MVPPSILVRRSSWRGRGRKRIQVSFGFHLTHSWKFWMDFFIRIYFQLTCVWVGSYSARDIEFESHPRKFQYRNSLVPDHVSHTYFSPVHANLSRYPHRSTADMAAHSEPLPVDHDAGYSTRTHSTLKNSNRTNNTDIQVDDELGCSKVGVAFPVLKEASVGHVCHLWGTTRLVHIFLF